MSGRNATGPMGRGPLTGRGMGVCAGSGEPRLGLGRQRGRNCRYGGDAFRATIDSGVATSQELLLEKKRALQNQLESINKEMEEL